MADPLNQTDPSTDPSTALVCPWCSTAVTPETVTCPSCDAILIADGEHDLPGLTAVDEAIARGEKRPAPSRGRFLSWFSAEQRGGPPTEADVQAMAPPDPEVQREIIRLELEAKAANLQAEADAIVSDAMAEGRVADLPEELRQMVITDEPAADDPAAPDDAAAPEADASTTDDTTA